MLIARPKNNLRKEIPGVNYIGMDSHITTLEFKVINEKGKLIKAQRVTTSAKNYIEFLKSVPKPRTVFTEEGPLASWLLETSLQYGEKLVITDPRRNRLIGSSGEKDDPIDAENLAQLSRGGYIKEIYHTVGHRRRFRELMAAYHDNNKSIVRIKNKIKAKFMQNGIGCAGETVYSKDHREKWRQKLPQDPGLLVIIDNLWLQLDQALQTQEEILSAAKTQSKQYPEIRLLDSIPGLGFINAATISSILETPHRFADKGKVWAYAGLGIQRRASGGKIYSEKLNTEYNRLLKYTAKQAAQAAIKSDNPFRRTYLKMTVEKGIPRHRAELTIARDILATAWAMWRNGEIYNPEIDKQLKN
jgi:transposase